MYDILPFVYKGGKILILKNIYIKNTLVLNAKLKTVTYIGCRRKQGGRAAIAIRT